ncbi:MAG: hypothetical protein AB7F35_01080 [Acetobacteraceae bacterium]
MNADIQVTTIEPTQPARQWIITGETGAQLRALIDHSSQCVKAARKAKGRQRDIAIYAVAKAKQTVNEAVEKIIGELVSFEIDPDALEKDGPVVIKEHVPTNGKADGKQFVITGDAAREIAELSRRKYLAVRAKELAEAEADMWDAEMWTKAYAAAGIEDDSTLSLSLDPSRFADRGEVVIREVERRNPGLGALLAEALMS